MTSLTMATSSAKVIDRRVSEWETEIFSNLKGKQNLISKIVRFSKWTEEIYNMCKQRNSVYEVQVLVPPRLGPHLVLSVSSGASFEALSAFL
jgi:hypothetical protein